MFGAKTTSCGTRLPECSAPFELNRSSASTTTASPEPLLPQLSRLFGQELLHPLANQARFDAMAPPNIRILLCECFLYNFFHCRWFVGPPRAWLRRTNFCTEYDGAIRRALNIWGLFGLLEPSSSNCSCKIPRLLTFLLYCYCFSPSKTVKKRVIDRPTKFQVEQHDSTSDDRHGEQPPAETTS